jgi:hypothetical protein
MKNNREKINKYIKNKRKINVNFKLSGNLRARLYKALKKNKKLGHTTRLLGCSIKYFKYYLEQKFKTGMNWNNWGTGEKNKGMKEWHIDHIKPCASFDLTKSSEQRKCFNYTNLQPLWAKENYDKRRWEREEDNVEVL